MRYNTSPVMIIQLTRGYIVFVSWNLFFFFSLCYSICSTVEVVTCPCVARDIRCVDLHWIKQNIKSEEEKLQYINISFATFLAKGVNVIFSSTTSDLVKQLLRCKMLAEFLHTLSPWNLEVLIIINHQEFKTLPYHFWFYFSALLFDE